MDEQYQVSTKTVDIKDPLSKKGLRGLFSRKRGASLQKNLPY